MSHIIFSNNSHKKDLWPSLSTKLHVAYSMPQVQSQLSTYHKSKKVLKQAFWLLITALAQGTSQLLLEHCYYPCQKLHKCDSHKASEKEQELNLVQQQWSLQCRYFFATQSVIRAVTLDHTKP